MTGIDPNLWPVIEPAPGFADATVARMLAESKRSHNRPRLWYRPFGLALVALFVSGAALGWVARQSRAMAPSAVAAQPLPTAVVVSVQPRIGHHRLPIAPQWKLATTNSALTSSAPAASLSAPEVATSAPTSSPVLRIPACQCARGYSDTICDCY